MEEDINFEDLFKYGNKSHRTDFVQTGITELDKGIAKIMDLDAQMRKIRV